MEKPKTGENGNQTKTSLKMASTIWRDLSLAPGLLQYKALYTIRRNKGIKNQATIRSKSEAP
jgi:hypothetical protein